MELINIDIDTTSYTIDNCRYCLENSNENTSTFLKPCNCTDPICVKCLKKWIESNKIIDCEICLEKFKIPAGIEIKFPTVSKKSYIEPTSIVSEYLIETSSESEQDTPDHCCYDPNVRLFLIAISSIILFMIFYLIANGLLF